MPNKSTSEDVYDSITQCHPDFFDNLTVDEKYARAVEVQLNRVLDMEKKRKALKKELKKDKLSNDDRMIDKTSRRLEIIDLKLYYEKKIYRIYDNVKYSVLGDH